MNTLWVGLTGNIGSGKSTVSARWAEHGAHVLDADAISRGLLDKDGGCYAEVVSAFPSVLLSDGRIDRKALGAIVFRDSSARERLNAIVHPAVCGHMLAAAEEAGRLAAERGDAACIVVFDVPLLFECGLDGRMDRNVLVYASDAVRLQRIVLRDGCSEEDATRRMASQRSQEEKRVLADLVIDNGGSLEALYRQADAVYAGFLSER